MAFVEQIVCDVCGAMKRETNHWRVLRTEYVSDAALKSEEDAGAEYLAIYSFDTLAPSARDTHSCGQQCVHKLVDRFLETGTLEAPAVRGEAAPPEHVSTVVPERSTRSNG